ncbi:hypothetical protein CB0940_08768 [Cercospora beticola]|uniref:Uncharacterized protein n=1 Tax=Cercospora beticola TaxID=122368 RepID=A0A2G5HQL5_CERBT|nr:hypothetical protein CB0940_08768 [Cercospora beticola]PIA94841.1 hypothetical protein CB0940_08768 [Cercospora beticola]
MPQEIARQWFVPGEGIDRHVISADIQRYLGNDATVRPGVGTGENQGVQGYWIKAYRNLTSAMIADLRADSARWRQEQRQTGTRGSKSPTMSIKSGLTVPDDSIEPYVGSSTYHASSAGRVSQKRSGGDSPNMDGPYGLPPSQRERERERIPVDRMQVDPPAPSRGSYPAPDRRAPYQPDGRPFPSESRGFAPDGRSSYPADTNMSGFGQPPVTSAYGQEPRYAPSYQQSNDGAPPGYVRQGNYFVPVSGYETAPSIPGRADPYGAGGYPQPPPQGRDPRETRYPPQSDYADPARYAYPSPAATVSSVSARDREPIASPPQQSPYGAIPAQQYDQYAGRPAPSNPQPSSGSSRTNRASVFGGLSGTSSSDRRRR